MQAPQNPGIRHVHEYSAFQSPGGCLRVFTQENRMTLTTALPLDIRSELRHSTCVVSLEFQEFPQSTTEET
jgi:hypothetical protein